MENKSITKEVNIALIKGESEIQIPCGEYEVKRAFISIRQNGVTIQGNGATLKGRGNLIDITNANKVEIVGLNLFSCTEKDFAIRINGAKEVVFTSCTFSCNAGCVVISDSAVTFNQCNFSGEKGNGICVLNASDVKINDSNFALSYGESITIADNRDGMVSIHNCSFKRCYQAIKSSGKNTLKITNNYFLTYNSALCFIPSIASKTAEGIYKAEMHYNLFDDCCVGGGLATIEIFGDKTEYNHKEITITENIFSQKERPVINATGVNYLIFKENNVRTDGESTVENSIINGIKA